MDLRPGRKTGREVGHLTPGSLYVERAIQVYRDGKLGTQCDPLVIETQLKVYLNGKELARLACSPINLPELAVGFLSSEGFISCTELPPAVELREDCQVWVNTAHLAEPHPVESGCFVNTASGRGYQPVTCLPPLETTAAFTAGHLVQLIDKLNRTSHTFQKTGGVHSAGLGAQDSLLVRFEDIGRHNAVDKVFGHAILNRIPLHDKCLVLSGRIAAEILLKAARNQVPLVLSRSAPTLRAVELAEQLGITVVGFARGERFNLYTHPEKIVP